MVATYLKIRNGWWYYQRRCPNEFHEVEPRRIISFALKTRNVSEARLKAARISHDLEQKWQNFLDRHEVFEADNASLKSQAAREFQASLGLQPMKAQELPDQELLSRLHLLLESGFGKPDQKAVLGLVEQPSMSMIEAFERFWDHIRDEWMHQSHDQRRGKRNIYLKAIRRFEEAVGKIPIFEVERSHALKFRTWWVSRVADQDLKPYTGNREINSLRRMFSVNYDIESMDKTNPFARVRLKETAEVSRIPLETKQIQALIKPGALGDLDPDFARLFRLLVNTGMRPVEAIGLELADVILEHEVPHVHVRRNETRSLKTDHSERLLPLLGVSLVAAEELVAEGGWGKRLGKNMYATSAISKSMRTSGIVTDKRQSFYSLRHWFQDQLTKRDVIDRAQAQLMGHKFQRPKYGYGKDLGELRDIVKDFAL